MIRATDLHRQFGSKHAVAGISFSVEKGEVLGFLGPNGAGKSTTMRMITGYLQPTSGEIIIDGTDMAARPEEAKRHIGYLPESAPLYTDMTVGAFLSFAAEMRGLRGGAIRESVEHVIDLCFLDSVRHQSIETLSKGFRHRTCLAQSLIHDPDILILDEPTDGLDPNQKHEIRTLIREMGKTKAIIFSTHILEEVEAACTRALIIDQGKLVADGSPAELLQRSPEAGQIRFEVGHADPAAVTAAIKALPGCSEVVPLPGDSDLFVARAVPAKKTSSSELAAAIAETLTTSPWTLQSLREEPGRLDEVFRRITSKETENPTSDQAA